MSDNDRWWVVTNFHTDPCCKAPCIATNGEVSICQTCGWTANFDEMDRYRDTGSTESDHDV